MQQISSTNDPEGGVEFCTEDLRQTALETFDLADQFCGSCKSFHILWPYIRLARVSGPDVGGPFIHTVLSRLLCRSGRRILIAGCADAGLLAIVARAANSGTHITALDRCQTPLELCRRFAARWSLSVDLLHLDLTGLAHIQRFDVVFVHALLQFIPTKSHIDVLTRLRRSLDVDGRLVIVFRTSARNEGNFRPEFLRDFPTLLIEQLEARNIALPESRQAFRRRIEFYCEERRGRAGAHTGLAEVEQMMTAAGFAIEAITPIDAIASEPFRQLDKMIGFKGYFLAVAAPSRTL